MSIRPAQISDASAIASLLHHSFYQTFATEKNESSVNAYLDTLKEDAIASMMLEKNTRFYCSEHNGIITGMIQLVYEEWESGSPALKVERLYIDTQHLGEGIGKSLLEMAIELAKNERMASIWLLVLRSNTRGVRFYEKMGFSTFNTSPGKFEEDDELDLWMRKELT